MTNEASIPICSSCGAPIAIDLEAASIRCLACGTDLAVDGALRGAMLRYVGDSRAALKKDLEARFVAGFYRQNELAATSFILGSVGVAISLTGLLLASVVTKAFATKLSWILFVVLAGAWLSSLAAFVRGWTLVFAPMTPERLRLMETAICSGCGATCGFAAGQASRKCRHCGGTSLVPSHLADRLLASVRAAADQSAAGERAALGRASEAGDRWIVPSVVTVVAVVVCSVVAIAVWGQPAGFALPTSALGALFALSFAAALPRLVGSVRDAGRARRALDSLIERETNLGARA
ncbi:MAG: hypothetical protein JNL21_20715 [Myxococcales bacterium]|nr:hypothetical protein [Myxococcales bacterium]